MPFMSIFFVFPFQNYFIKSKTLIMRKILILMGMSATMLCNTSCESKKEEKQEQVTFLVTSPVQKDTMVLVNYVCQIRAIQHIELRALEKGYLQKIYVDEGKYVKQGQLMFQIMPVMYNAEFNKAEAEVNFVEREYLNTKSLADSNIVSKNELALAKAKLNKAKAEMSIAQVHLSFTSIKAPFSGIMDHFQVRLGSLVNEGDLLTTMSDNSKMWVYFNVPEAEYLNIKTHQNKEDMLNVKLLMANNQMFKFPGIVQTVEADFNNETGNIAFRATFPNPEGLLRHGETGSIVITQPLKAALMIPQKATFEVLEKKYVYVVDKNNVIKSREIKIAAELPNIFVIQSGLKKDDKILLEGLRQVNENQKIQYKFLQPESVISNLSLYAE